MYHEDQLRLMAYRIWEDEGRPEGRDKEHWFRAASVWQDSQRRKQAGQPAEEPYSPADISVC